MELTTTAALMLGLVLAGWTFAAAALALAARDRARQAKTSRAAVRRLARMIEHSPAIPLLVRGDGAIEGSPRLAAWLGLDALPEFLSELRTPDAGLEAEELERLRQAVRRTLKTAAPFRMHVTPRGSRRSLAVCGQFAERLVAPQGAALVWWFDFSESDEELAQLRNELALLRVDFGAVMRLIEAAPLAMWFRGPDLALRIVNDAYAQAVGAQDPGEVLRGQIELVEALEGRTPAEVAGEARSAGRTTERVVSATIGGQRRALKVCDLPLGEDGVAGFAIDIEEQESQGRALRAFSEAQRAMLDLLSVAVAQFDYHRRLAYANQPFARLFGLGDADEVGPMEFHRFLDRAREAGRLPETGDFPAWRRGLGNWFGEHDPVEEVWTLADGTHLRVVGLPTPDGGLVLLAENRSEHLALSAARDILLRTRTTIFDCLGEALAIFAADGTVQIWNRRFPELWGLPADYLAERHRAEDMLSAMARTLAEPQGAGAIGEAIRAATLERRSQSGQVRLEDGRSLEFSTVPLPDGNGLLLFRDVTAREQAEAASRERDIALARADQEQSEFLIGIAAALRTRIVAIGGSAEALRSGAAGSLPSPAADHLTAILDAARGLEAQVTAAFERAGRAAGLPDQEAPSVRTEVELLPLLTTIVREREAAIEAKEMTLDLRGSRRAGTTLADERQLARAIGMLLDEAIAAAPRGGRILVNLSRARREALIEISGPVERAGSASDAGGLARTTGRAASPPGRTAPVELARLGIEAQGGRVELRMAADGTNTAIIALR